MRLSLLIVDDNDYERDSLSTCVNWKLLGIENIYMAENGRRAWEIYTEHRPDIIITDIKMPEEDGLELMHRLHADGSTAKVIVVSAYDSFSYAQSALSLKAFSYILKPVSSRELTEAVRSAVDMIITEQLDNDERERYYSLLDEMREVGLEKYMHSFLTDDMSLSERSELFSKMCRVCSLSFQPQYVVLAFRHTESNLQTFKNTVLASLRGRFSYEAGFALDAETFVVVIDRIAMETDEFIREITGWLDAQESKQRLAAGVSKLNDNVLNMPDMYRQALQNLARFQRSGYGMCFFSDAAPEEDGMEDIVSILADIEKNMFNGVYPEELCRELRSALKGTRDIAEVKSAFISFASRIMGNPELIRLCAGDNDDNPELLNSSELFKAIIRCESVSLVMDVISAWCMSVSERFAYRLWDKKRKTAEEIKHIIDTEYEKEISLKYISERIFLSSNYTHILFKLVFGTTINHYLTEVRIDNASRLLAETDVPISQIAERVGYKNATYFFSLFKRITGETPAEYRRIKQKEASR